MNIYILLLSLISLLISCETSKKITPSKINGYWEIEKVVAPNGEEKPYTFNAFVDLFKMETDSTGYKVKLKPSFRGVYEGNNIKQYFKITQQKDSYTVQYKVNKKSWSETLIEATKKRIVLKNHQGVSFVYKPFTPITVE